MTMPVADPIVAISGAPLVHVPPPTPSVNMMVWPAHTPEGPLIGVGTGLTVTTCRAAQPVAGKVYNTVSVPADKPVSVEPERDATVGVVWLQPPPAVASASVVLSPMHTCAVPVIASGTALTVIIFVALQPVLSV